VIKTLHIIIVKSSGSEGFSHQDFALESLSGIRPPDLRILLSWKNS